MSDEVWIETDGRRYGGWKSVTVQASVNSQARAFGVACTYDTPDGLTPDAIKPGSVVKVLLGTDVVCTGYVDSVAVAYDSSQISVQVSGRSKTSDLIDCTPVPPGLPVSTQSASWASQPAKGAMAAPASSAWSWENSTVDSIVNALAAPYGVSVKVMAKALGEKLTNFTVTPGETVFASIRKLVTIANLVVCDDADGSLIIAEPGSAGTCTDALTSGVNVLSGEAANDVSGCMSSYQVLGQHKGGDAIRPYDSCSDEGLATDSAVTRLRHLTIVDSGQQTSVAQCQEQADFEAAFRRARSQAFTLSVQGWRQASGQLWPLNGMVQVSDPVLGRNGQYLITDVTWTLDENGSITTLGLMPPEGYKATASKTTVSNKTVKTSGTSAGGGGGTWADVKPVKS